MWSRAIVVAALMLALPSSRPAPAQADAGFCGAAEAPHFVNELAQLADELGDVLGEPLECVHTNLDNGDLLQRTTTGLASYRASLEMPVFTDGIGHWALTNTGIKDWTSQPPT